MQFNIPRHVEKKRIKFLESFMGRTLRKRHVPIVHHVQQSVISDLARCQLIVSTLPSLSFFSLHFTLPGRVFTAYAIHKFIKHERRCVWTDPSPRRGNFIEEGVGGGGVGKKRVVEGRFPAYFLLPLYPCPVYFILEIPVEASTGNTEPDLKSPSPASLSDRSVIL